MISGTLRVLFKLLFFVSLNSCLSVDSPITPGSIPPRSPRALDGFAFAKTLRYLDEMTREKALLRELRRGNLPNFLRQMSPVRYRASTRSGRSVLVTLWVMRDYLAVGSDADFIRVPMNPVTAQRIADSLGYQLPTARIVDEIYKSAGVHLAPKPFKPSQAMVSVEEFVKHDSVIRGQLQQNLPVELIAGHKKDIVISNQLNDRPKKLAIYGWHQLNGSAIQPLSTVHGNWYADYSHGIRLLSGTMLIDREALPLAEVLQDPELAPLVSYEGPLTRTRYRTDDAEIRKNWWPHS